MGESGRLHDAESSRGLAASKDFARLIELFMTDDQTRVASAFISFQVLLLSALAKFCGT